MGKLIGSPSRFTARASRSAVQHLAELAESSAAAREAISTATSLLASLAGGPQDPPPASAMPAPRRRRARAALGKVLPFSRTSTTFGLVELGAVA